MGDPDGALSALADTVRVESRRVLATLVRRTGRFDLAEDAVQDAVEAALRTWPRDGVPDSPRAWLTTVAGRRAIDRIRREQRRGRTQELAMQRDEPDADPWDAIVADLSVEPAEVLVDDRLRLIFTCCHPTLGRDARVALTLRTVCGLAVDDIAALLLVSRDAMQRRLVRARRKIVDARIPYRIPRAEELPARVDAVIDVVRLLYTAGHRAASGDRLVRPEHTREALRLAGELHELLPDVAAVEGLLALLQLSEARGATRLGPDGELVLLPAQDRTAWDADLVRDGVEHATRAWRRSGDRPRPVVVEAAIASVHAIAPDHRSTDWQHVARLYELLDEAHTQAGRPSIVVRANRAVVVAEVSGPAAALALLDAPDVVAQPGVTRHVGWHVVRAHLLGLLGRTDEQRAELRAALVLDPPAPEAAHLRRLLDRAVESA